MAFEIERKFLVKKTKWVPPDEGRLCRQAYLSALPYARVRVRVLGESGVLTIKTERTGIRRLEYEYQIPYNDACELIDSLCERPVIEKTRYRVLASGRWWDVDEYHGGNQGLLTAEVEVDAESDKVTLPEWVGREVSMDPRFWNGNLLHAPFSSWQNREDGCEP